MEAINSLAVSTQARLGVNESTAQVLVWVVIIFAVYLLVQVLLKPIAALLSGGSKKRGNLLLLLGQNGAGKTALFFRLKDDEDVQTISSMKPLRDTLQISIQDHEEVSVPIETVDCPGHQRLRTKAAELLRQARAIVYVIDAQDKARLKDVAEHLYELLTCKEVNEFRPPMLLACNKTDLKDARTEKFVTEEIEREIERMRVSRGAGLQGEDAADSYLGVDGEKFKLLEHSPCPIESCSISVKAPKLAPLLDFLRSSFA